MIGRFGDGEKTMQLDNAQCHARKTQTDLDTLLRLITQMIIVRTLAQLNWDMTKMQTPNKPPYVKDHIPSGLKNPRPNIVMFMPDQLRYDALGCSGNAVAKTPNLDKFASRGSRFTNCFTQASVCSQSRCSMFTGTYPHVSGHRSLENLIKPWEPNVFRSLKESGYHVACLAPRG